MSHPVLIRYPSPSFAGSLILFDLILACATGLNFAFLVLNFIVGFSDFIVGFFRFVFNFEGLIIDFVTVFSFGLVGSMAVT